MYYFLLSLLTPSPSKIDKCVASVMKALALVMMMVSVLLAVTRLAGSELQPKSNIRGHDTYYWISTNHRRNLLPTRRFDSQERLTKSPIKLCTSPDCLRRKHTTDSVVPGSLYLYIRKLNWNASSVREDLRLDNTSNFTSLSTHHGLPRKHTHPRSYAYIQREKHKSRLKGKEER